MLSKNIKELRKEKGVSQEELAAKLCVVRQTVSKWETGLSVPDSEMLIRIAEELDTSVSILLGDTVAHEGALDIKVLARKLEIINEQLAKQAERRRKALRALLIIVGGIAFLYIIKNLISDIYYLYTIKNISENTSIIGGADAPTSIYVTGGSVKITEITLAAIAAIGSAIGIYHTRRK